MVIIKKVDNRLVEKCNMCHTKLQKNNSHHFLCHQCWKEKQYEKGNFALVTGIKQNKRYSEEKENGCK